MTPDKAVQDQLNIDVHFTQLTAELKRIAHALEALAKQNVPNFKTLGETPRQQR